MTTNEKKVIGRIVIVGLIRDTMVAYVGRTVEPMLSVILDPVISLISNQECECYVHDSLDGVATPVGTRRNRMIRVNLRVSTFRGYISGRFDGRQRPSRNNPWRWQM